MSDTTLSLFSTYFAYAGLVVSTLAFGFFIAAFSLSRTVKVQAEQPALVTAGAPTGAPTSAATEPVDVAPNRGMRWANIGMSLS